MYCGSVFLYYFCFFLVAFLFSSLCGFPSKLYFIKSLRHLCEVFISFASTPSYLGLLEIRCLRFLKNSFLHLEVLFADHLFGQNHSSVFILNWILKKWCMGYELYESILPLYTWSLARHGIWVWKLISPKTSKVFFFFAIVIQYCLWKVQY